MRGSSRGRIPRSLITFTAAASAGLASAAAMPAYAGTAWASPTPPARLSRPVHIRVRVAEGLPVVSIRGFDLRIYHLPDSRATRRLAFAPDRESSWELRCQGGKIQAESKALRKKLTLASPASVDSPAGFIRLGDLPYRESLAIHSVGGACEVVNEVDIERYLDGLVNSEFSAKWNEEAIAAQVVAARTYALYQMRQARLDKDSRYDVESTVRDQVYGGTQGEDYRASRAVDRTRGMILSPVGSKEPLKAYYHSTCGGATALPESVWGVPQAGFKHGVRCPYCWSSPRFKWDLVLEDREIAASFLKAARPEPSLKWPKDWKVWVEKGNLLSLQISARDAAGRSTRVETVWARDGKSLALELSANRFREWVGAGRLRSTYFEVSRDPAAGARKWNIAGRGNGHGVGMCQWGAKVMGEQGHKMASILKFYYPDAVLRKLW